VFARIAHYYTADPSSPFWELAQSRPVRVRVREMLRQMDGYEGSSFFLDRKSGKAISISLWESEEAINRSEEAMRPLREEMARSLAANIVDVEHYEVGEMAVQDIRERERVEQELQVARRIQQASLPKEVPTPEGWQIAPFYRPAREVGGDFYDFLKLPNGRLGIVVGDATGKGVPAALVMSSARSMLRAVAQASDSPGDVLRRVNDPMVTDIPPNMFVTCFYAILDPYSASLSYANAGHDLPYLRRRGGDAEELMARGMPLGLMPRMGYEEKEIILEPSDSALFYSDGLVEAHDPEGEMFGFPRLRALVAERGGERSLEETLLEELYSFVGEGWEQEDDITLLTLKRSASLS
jgi:serine phosphatase RsbU (regulator of sigma subunit)